jgi:hypothetical protein
LVLGVLAPVLVFLVALERRLPWYAALLGGVLMAAAPAHIIYSSRLKQYTGEAVVATLLLWAGWRTVDRPASWPRWLTLAGVGVVAAVFSAIAAVFAGTVIAVCALVALSARSYRPPLVAAGAFAVVAGPWLLAVVSPNTNQDLVTRYWRGHYELYRLRDVMRGFGPGDWLLVGLLVALAATIVLFRRPRVGILLVVPTLVATGFALLEIAPLGTQRTDIYLYPCYALLGAATLGELATIGHGRWIAAATALLIIVVVLAVSDPAGEGVYPQEVMTPLVRLVERSRTADEPIVVYPLSGYAYGFASSYPITRERDAFAGPGWAVRSPRAVVLPTDCRRWPFFLNNLEGRRAWLIGSHFQATWRVLLQMLEARGYTATRTYTRPGAALVRLVRGPPAPERSGSFCELFAAFGNRGGR